MFKWIQNKCRKYAITSLNAELYEETGFKTIEELEEHVAGLEKSNYKDSNLLKD